MIERVIVHPGRYHDSAFLMRLGRELQTLPGVDEAVVLMGTEMNLALIREAGFPAASLAQVTPLDLVVALRAGDDSHLEAAGVELERLLEGLADERVGAAGSRGRQAASLQDALTMAPETNLVTVAVPGQYAAFVAGRALDQGRHVFLFSDNVPIQEEIDLKRRARERGLLLMGPDCGTSILAGVGLGFANRVRRGSVGLVGASGTGLQELCCQIHQAGLGISQAIGTGGRDLSAEVGGVMTRFGLELLDSDPETRIIGLVAKRPAPEVAQEVHRQLAGISKPVVVRWLGQETSEERDRVAYTADLDEAARRLVQAEKPAWQLPDPQTGSPDPPRVQGRLLGLYTGGSLASEAALCLRSNGLEVDVGEQALSAGGPLPGGAHLVVDTGDDAYTVGRPHPMIDPGVRNDLIRGLGARSEVGALLLDLVLGDGAHPDPAPGLTEAVAAARAERPGQALEVVASITGTDLDPQDTSRQRALLLEAGIRVAPSAHRAAQIAAAMLGATSERSKP